MKKLNRRSFLKRTAAFGGAALLADNLIAQARAQSDEVITVRYLTPLWASTQDRRVERQLSFNDVLESFNDRYADQGIQVEEIIGDGNPVTVTQEMDAGSIDSAWINHSLYPNHLLAGQVVDLEPYLNGEADEFFDWTTEALRGVNGTLAALWHNTDTPLLYYNSEAVPEPPRTWSEVTALAEAYREENPRGYAITYPFIGWQQMNTGMYEALGGTWFAEDGSPIMLNEENRAIWERMMRFYLDLLGRDLIPASAVANDQVQQMPDVYAGTVQAFAGNSNFHIRQLQPNLPEEEYAKWSAVPLPYPDEAGQGLYQAGGWLIAPVTTGDAAREAAAAAWTLHATGYRALRDTCLAGAWIPTRPEVLEDPLFAQDPFAQVTLEALDQGHVVPLNPLIGSALLSIDNALTSAASGQATLQEALDAAATEIQREYEAFN